MTAVNTPRQRRDPEPPAGARRGSPSSPRTAPARAPPRPTSMPRRGRRASARALLAVCGLCGGAGASTLAYLVALAAARSASGRGARRRHRRARAAGSPATPACEAPRSLVEVAEHVAAGLPAGQLFADHREGVRVLATGPRFTPECAREGIELLLDHARERYALTVIDCGTLAREADQVALASASHVAWVLPASASGVRRARRVLEAINPYLLGRELIVARHDDARAQGSAARAQAPRRAPPRDAGAAAHPARPRNRRPRPRRSKQRRCRCKRSRECWRDEPEQAESHAGRATSDDRAAPAPRSDRRDACRPDARTDSRGLPRRSRAVDARRRCCSSPALVRVALAAQARELARLLVPRASRARPTSRSGSSPTTLRAILGVFGLLLIAQIAARAPGGAGPRPAGHPSRRRADPGRCDRRQRAGRRRRASAPTASGWSRAVLPHGPDRARRLLARARACTCRAAARALPAATWPRSPRSSVALLALAAALETFVNV